MKINNINRGYLFKHWIFTLLLGPVISQIMMHFYVLNPHKAISLLEVYPITFLLSLIFSIPTYAICSFIYILLAKNDIKNNYAKTLLISIPVVGIFITTAMIGGTASTDIALSYSITSIITGLIFKLNFEDES